MYYYQWPYVYYYQPCYWGCTDPSQCQFQQHYYYSENLEGQHYLDPGQQVMTQFSPATYHQDNETNNYEPTNPLQQQALMHEKKIMATKQNNLTENILVKLEDLQDKLGEIEKENEQLKEKVSNLKPINIENINYKIQELTVEELSGSLNIGLSALTDAENLKKLLEEKGEIKFNDLDTAAMENLEEMENFNGG